MSNLSDDAKKPRIPELTSANYYVWYAAVCDELFAIDAELLYEKAALTAHNAEQAGNVDVQDVDLPTRKKAYILIQRSLSQEIKAKLLDVGRGEVETLLRRIRLCFYKPSPHMVEMLHDKIASMVVDNYATMDAYTLEFKQTAAQMLSCGGKVDDSLLRMWYLKGLPSDYAMVKFNVTASNSSLADTYTAITAFAGTDPKLTGSTHPARKQGRHERASTANERQTKPGDLCKNFAETGKCSWGSKCKWAHVTKPSSGKESKAPNAAATPTSDDCAHCKKVGNVNRTPHTTENCHRKTWSCDTCKVKGKHTTPRCPTTLNAKADKAAATNEVDGEYDPVDVTDYNVALMADDNAQPNAASKQTTFKLLIDGGANCAIFTSTAGMTNLRSASIDIKVGGGMVHCSQVGDFAGDLITDHGKPVHVTIADARVCPDFGQNIIPDTRFTNAGYKISKSGTTCTISRASVTFSATQSKDKLFYFTVKPAATVAQANANAHATTALTAVDTNANAAHLATELHCFVDATTAETCVQCGAVDHAYVARTYDTFGTQLILQHHRYGHRNLAEVARIEGVTLPPKPIFCRTCVEGKSTRLSLSKRRVEPVYNAPRPAYAWHTDVAGPFSTRTPEGHNLFRLLVCGYSRFRKGELISTTADFHVAWEQHITSVETDLGRPSVVAQLISDSAKYYDTDALDALNLKKGVVHLFSPPYTQGLNHIVERDTRTILEMARCMLIQSAAPKNRYGRALLYSTYILNRLPYATDANESCIERYYQRTIANPRKNIRVFGKTELGYVLYA